MKTLSFGAFIGCIVAIGLAIQFDEIEDVKETEDLPGIFEER